MIEIIDNHPLSEFQRNAKDILRRLKADGRPRVLTINDRAEVVIQDAES